MTTRCASTTTTAVILAIATLAGPIRAQAPEGLTGTLVVLNKQGDDASFVDLATGSIVAICSFFVT